MAIKTYTIHTGLGQSDKFIEILGTKHGKAMNDIGYSGKHMGIRTTRQAYLDSISNDAVEYSIKQTGFDCGDFAESYELTVATRDEPNELVEYINRLENDSFECWSDDAKSGYLTALGSVKAKIAELNRK